MNKADTLFTFTIFKSYNCCSFQGCFILYKWGEKLVLNCVVSLIQKTYFITSSENISNRVCSVSHLHSSCSFKQLFIFPFEEGSVRACVVSLFLPQRFCMFSLMSENEYGDDSLVSDTSSSSSSSRLLRFAFLPRFQFCGSWLRDGVVSRLTTAEAALCFDNCMWGNACFAPPEFTLRSNHNSLSDRLTFSQNDEAHPPRPPPGLQASAQSVLKLQFDPSVEEVHTLRV